MDIKKFESIVESRYKALEQRKQMLAEAWNPIVGKVDTFYQQKHNRNLTEHEKRNMAMCLENLVNSLGARQRASLFEATTSSDIAFLGVQLPVVAALLPSLVLNDLAIVQTLDRRSGAIFYLDVKYGQTKGSVTSGDTMIGSKTGHATGVAQRRYASEMIPDESIGSAGSTNYTGNLSYLPVTAGSVIITDGTETFTDDGSGALVTDISSGTNGTINYTTGAYNVTFASTTTAAVTAQYEYDYEKNLTTGVPEVNVGISSETITAKDFPIRAKFSLGSAYDLEKAYSDWAVCGGIRRNNNLLNSVDTCHN